VLDDHQLLTAADEVATALEFAQMTAMSAGAETRVTVDQAAEKILVEQFESNPAVLGGSSSLHESIVEVGSYGIMEYPLNRGTDYDIDLADDTRLSAVDIVAATFGPHNFVIFDVLGMPSEGGSVTLSLGNRQQTVTLESVTGRVVVSE
jgi:hypothetical protein